jgi:predicted DNA-binding protein (MmcQ/YjbR family)
VSSRRPRRRTRPTTPDALRTFCLELPGAREEFPFSPGVSVFKVGARMFALSALASEPLEVSVKCNPELGEALRNDYDAVAPGWHLNKRHWLTVTVGGDLPDAQVRDLVEDSYDLVKPKRPQP